MSDLTNIILLNIRLDEKAPNITGYVPKAMSEAAMYITQNSIYGPCHAKTCLRAYADRDVPDQPAHPRSLIRALAVRKHDH